VLVDVEASTAADEASCIGPNPSHLKVDAAVADLVVAVVADAADEYSKADKLDFPNETAANLAKCEDRSLEEA
jgi:hypothetical protein